MRTKRPIVMIELTHNHINYTPTSAQIAGTALGEAPSELLNDMSSPSTSEVSS